MATACSIRVILLCMAVSAMLGRGERKNVLFLMSDDLRAQLGAYHGQYFPDPMKQKMYTPNLDELASHSLFMLRSYVQQAVCNPSRTSLLTGRRPDSTRVFDQVTYFRRVAGNFTTIPQYFKENGYITAGMGKIFHPSQVASGDNDPISWTEPYFEGQAYPRGPNSWMAVSKESEEKHPLIDQTVAQHAVQTLRKLAPAAKAGKQNFFVAVGFHRPHLPFEFPERYLQYYNDTKNANNQHVPDDFPDIAWGDWDELRSYSDIQSKHYSHGAYNSSVPDDIALDLRKAYYASISYMDGLVGEVVSELDKLGLRNSTVITFVGDHGWQLGEHNEWCKMTNFEITTQAPMIIHVPGLTDKGIPTARLTEFVDLFPTVSEAAGLGPVPLCPESESYKVKTCTEGISVLPLAADPQQQWKSAAFSQYPRRTADGTTYMGYTMRTEQYRYTEWTAFNMLETVPYWGMLCYSGGNTELYDHVLDPYENVNRANDPSMKEIRKKLSHQLRKGWRHALPSAC